MTGRSLNMPGMAGDMKLRTMSALREKPPVFRMTPRRALMRCSLPPSATITPSTSPSALVSKRVTWVSNMNSAPCPQPFCAALGETSAEPIGVLVHAATAGVTSV